MADLIEFAGKEDFGFKPYPSYYNVFNPLLRANFAGVPAKQHFVYNFVGAALRTDIWLSELVTGTGGSGAMFDGIDEGFEIIANNNGGTIWGINFNSIRHYDADGGCVFIIVCKSVDVSATQHFGLAFDHELRDNFDPHFGIKTRGGETYRLFSRGTANGEVDTAQSGNESVFRRFEGEVKINSIELKIDGILKATNATAAEQPTGKLQPVFHVTRWNSNNRSARIRYYEAYNT